MNGTAEHQIPAFINPLHVVRNSIAVSMFDLTKCLIDNKSLEHAGYLLSGDLDNYYLTNEVFIKSLGGLSNYINALLLYDDIKFIANGRQTFWYRFPWFKDNTRMYVEPVLPRNDNINWSDYLNIEEGVAAKNYLLASKYLDADLFISPDRAKEVIADGSPTIDDNFITTLNKIDEKIKVEKNEVWYDDIKVGIEQNFIFPSLTHYVLSEASNTNDLLTVIMQLKASGEIKKVRAEITELSKSTMTASRLQKEIEQLIKKHFAKSVSGDKSWSIRLSVLCLSIGKSFGLENFKVRKYLTFLKDLIACRTEAHGLENDIKRVFNKKIDFNY